MRACVPLLCARHAQLTPAARQEGEDGERAGRKRRTVASVMEVRREENESAESYVYRFFKVRYPAVPLRARTGAEACCAHAHVLAQTLLREWAHDLEERPEHVKRSVQGKVATKTQKQCKDYMKPFFKLCERKVRAGRAVGARCTVALTRWRHAGAAEAVAAAHRQDGGSLPAEGVREGGCAGRRSARGWRSDLTPRLRARALTLAMQANDEYLRLAIGNSPWPIGVTSVGIHQRTGREKIESNKIARIPLSCRAAARALWPPSPL